MSGFSLPKEVVKYEDFVNDVLKKRLRDILEDRTKVCDEIAEYKRLISWVEATEALKKSCPAEKLKSRVDLGCGFFVNAESSSKETDTVFVAVGFGIFAEFTLEEAKKYCRKKIPILESKSSALGAEASGVKADIRIVLGILSELQGLPKEDEGRERRDIWS